MIIFFYGEDSFRIKYKLTELKNRFTDTVDQGSFSLSEINGEKANMAELSEKINTGSLFTKKRMIIIKNIFANKQKEIFEKILILIKKQTGSQDNILVFIDEKIINNKLNEQAKKLFSYLKKQKYGQEFNLLNQGQVLKFAKEKFQKKKQKINPKALSLLITKTNNDLWRLENEINKLSSLFLNKEIDSQAVEEMVAGQIEEKIFILIDSFFTKNKTLAYKTLNEQLSADLSPDYILSMLIRQIKILLEIKSAQKNISSDKLASTLNLHPFVVKKSLNQANQLSLNQLKKAFQQLIEIDYKNKTGKTDLKNELFILAAKGLLF
jgi:DNA polymerase III subunit delta